MVTVLLFLSFMPVPRSDAPGDDPPFARLSWILGGLAVLWLTGAVGGLWVVWAYENRAGASASAPEQWPGHSGLTRAAAGPTLILLAHPRCACTQASLGELAEVLARTNTPPKTYVLFLKPEGFAEGWEHTDLWQLASTLPNATLVRDDDGIEARRFGAVTSGQTLLYDARGTLAFSGGITGSRGHQGENAGRVELIALLNGTGVRSGGTSVFGCPLFSPGSRSTEETE
jgi:hypothetical protein